MAKRGDAGVVKPESAVVLFQSYCVETEAFAVHAIETDADASLNDQIVRDHLIENMKRG